MNGPFSQNDPSAAKWVRVAALVLAGGALGITCASGADYFVSPSGKDTNPGTRAEPFGTFNKAQQAVRAQRTAQPGAGVTVTFLPGTYELTGALEFGPADSGASEAQPVVYRADPGGPVIISGGRGIKGWEQAPGRPGTWRARAGQDAGRFEQLWVNGRRAIRARAPNYWEFAVLNGVTEDASGSGTAAKHVFTTAPESLAVLKDVSAEALRDAQIMVFHKWDTTREWLQSASPANGTLTGLGAKMQSWNKMERDCLFYVENLMAALDAPGEWFLDRDEWVYYRPRAGEDMTRAEAVAPVVERFAVFGGTADKPDEWVRHIRFDGLKFRYAAYNVPAPGVPPAQAAMNVQSAAIQLDAARDIQFLNCAVEHIGTTAFWFRHAVRDCRVEKTRMFDLGITGVRIGEANIVPEPVRTGGIGIENCIIHSGGRIAPHAVAVWIGHSADNVLSHCDVADFFYTAVSVGWRWGYAESAAKRNKIEFNHLHHLGYRILSDMGGVYTLGPSEGTVVRNNVIHDVYSTRYGGWGLYPDEGSTGILLENNLVYDVKDGCVHQHYGKENLFRNNVLAFSEEGQVAVTRAEPHLSFTFERNIVYWDDGRLLGYGGWNAGAKVELRNNLYWRAGGKPFDFGGKTWEQWRASGRDAGSVIADPMFVNPEARDFRLKPGSPAEKIGFVPIDYSQAGVQGDAAWKKLAASTVYPKPYVVPSPKPIGFKDDFENASASPALSLASVHVENHPELVAISDEAAASGKRSLRVQDRADLQAGYNPHFYWDPHYTSGRARLAFKIRLEPGADLLCEWRGAGNPYQTGPSIHLREGGIFSRGRKLMDVPAQEWLGVEMRSPVGKADARWELKLVLPGGAAKEFKDLQCDSTWKEARWIGISSFATKAVKFYLDDLELENK